MTNPSIRSYLKPSSRLRTSKRQRFGFCDTRRSTTANGPPRRVRPSEREHGFTSNTFASKRCMTQLFQSLPLGAQWMFGCGCREEPVLVDDAVISSAKLTDRIDRRRCQGPILVPKRSKSNLTLTGCRYILTSYANQSAGCGLAGRHGARWCCCSDARTERHARTFTGPDCNRLPCMALRQVSEGVTSRNSG